MILEPPPPLCPALQPFRSWVLAMARVTPTKPLSARRTVLARVLGSGGPPFLPCRVAGEWFRTTVWSSGPGRREDIPGAGAYPSCGSSMTHSFGCLGPPSRLGQSTIRIIGRATAVQQLNRSPNCTPVVQDTHRFLSFLSPMPSGLGFLALLWGSTRIVDLLGSCVG